MKKMITSAFIALTIASTTFAQQIPQQQRLPDPRNQIPGGGRHDFRPNPNRIAFRGQIIEYNCPDYVVRVTDAAHRGTSYFVRYVRINSGNYHSPLLVGDQRRQICERYLRPRQNVSVSGIRRGEDVTNATVTTR